MTTPELPAISKYTEINVDEWNRKSHFEFFMQHDLPFFNITTEVDVTDLWTKCKAEKSSFFLSSLHTIMKAVNQIEEFKTRLKGNRPVVYETIHVGTTHLFEDGIFRYVYLPFVNELESFITTGKSLLSNSKGQKELQPMERPDLIYFSSLPWISFTGLRHPCNLGSGDSVPRIVTGKVTQKEGRFMMPVAVDAHHAIMDGFHAGQFFNAL